MCHTSNEASMSHSRSIPVVGVVLVGEGGKNHQFLVANHHQDTAAHVVEQVPGAAKNNREARGDEGASFTPYCSGVRG